MTRMLARLLFGALLSAAPAAAQQAALPTPESVLGFKPGADFKLATYEESLEYFRRLDAASDRLRLLEVGRTSEGRPWYLALISSAENLRDLERYRDIAQRLAHPDGLADSTARRLAREGKAFVDVSGGLHASEVAGAQHTIQLAYDLLVTAAEPRTKAILDNVILFLWPSLNPDGQDIVVNWYRENVGTPYEVSPLHELYQKYIGHDNNRDAYMLNVPESRVIARAWRQWEPQIIYVHHQTAPFPTRIWLPPFAEPIASRAPGLISRELNAIGMLIAQGLESKGQVGATHMGTGFDAWYPGYIDYMPVLQNIAAFWTETALYRYATPRFYTIDEFPPAFRDLRPGALYASPWAGGWWRLADAVAYMVTASLATLDYAAKYREDLLHNRFQAGRDAILRYRREPPYAYMVPEAQRDPMAAVELLRRLAFNGIRVARLTREVTHENATWPRGTWVIPMDQEFAELARQLLERQEYPDLREYPNGPPEQPYDAAGWSLPLQMDVNVVEVRQPLSDEVKGAMAMVQGAAAAPADAPDAPLGSHAVAGAIVPTPGRISGAGPRIAVNPAENNAFRLLNRAVAAGGTVRFESGRYTVEGIADATIARWVEELAVRATRTGRSGGYVVRPRIALYQPWRASMDEGWTRWLLDQYGFAYATITNTDARGGNLRQRFDVIVLASDSPRGLLEGYAKGTVPPRYEGGIAGTGVRMLDAFVREGGTLVTLNQSADFAIQQLHLPVRNVVAGVDRKEFFASGSILEVTTDSSHPVMAGMPERAKVFVDGSPVFETLRGFEGAALARYASTGSPLLSGYLLGEKHLQGRAAALEVRHGRGRVLLIGFRPQWRGQPFGTFRVVFNAVLFGGELASRPWGSPGFWATPADSARR
jgi:hypothetical protein